MPEAAPVYPCCQLKTGQGYRHLEPVISVHILGFRLLPQEQKFAHYHHVFEILERRTGYRLSDHLELHTIEMPKFFKRPTELSTEEEKWLYFLEHGHELTTEQVQALGLPEIVEAEEKLRVISQDRVLRIRVCAPDPPAPGSPLSAARSATAPRCSSARSPRHPAALAARPQ